MHTKKLLREAQLLEKSLVEDRRCLHACAETGFDLKETFSYVWKRLEETGLSPQKCGRCGIICAIGRPGKTILLRADMDALPIREESGLPFACTKGNMHACGHDMHTAMLLGAAQLLKEHESELQGTVRLMFQPAEEILAGAQDMIDSGALENPRVDAAMMLHVMTGQDFSAGTVIIPAPGVSAPAAGMFSVRIRGRGAHGAMPHAGVDPINAAAHMVIALQEIIARELSPSENAALTIGAFQSGAAANAIPDSALLRGNFRAFSDDTFAFIKKRIADICTGTASVFRTDVQVDFEGCCPTLVNDAALCTAAHCHAAQLLGENMVIPSASLPGGQASGSEDFAAVSHRVPSLMLALAAGRKQDGYAHPLHHPAAAFDERALVPGAALYACAAINWLDKNGSAE